MAQVILTNHVKYRILERKIDASQAIQVAKNPIYSKSGEDGTVIKGATMDDGRTLEVVCREMVIMGRKTSKIIILTAYYLEDS